MIFTEFASYLVNTNDDEARNDRQRVYLDYIKNHIKDVQKAFDLYFQPILDNENISFMTDLFSMEDFRNALLAAKENILHHDDSKLTDEEFDAYRLYYYPTKAEEHNDEIMKSAYDNFLSAWEHHYRNNSHHPKYWINDKTGLPDDMSLDAIIEMVCDWLAMSMMKNENILEWYNNKADEEKKDMSEKTKNIVEFLLNNLSIS